MPAAPMRGFTWPRVCPAHGLAEENARHGVEADGEEAQAEDGERLRGQEGVAFHRAADREAQEQRHHVGDLVLRGLRQARNHAALAHEIAEA